MSRRMAFLHLPPIRWLTSFYNPPKKYHLKYSKFLKSCHLANIPLPSSKYLIYRQMGKDLTGLKRPLPKSNHEYFWVSVETDVQDQLTTKDNVSNTKQILTTDDIAEQFRFLNDPVKEKQIAKVLQLANSRKRWSLTPSVRAYKQKVKEYNNHPEKHQANRYNYYYEEKKPKEPKFISDVSVKGMHRVYKLMNMVTAVFSQIGEQVDDNLTITIGKDEIQYEIKEDQDKVPHALTKDEEHDLAEYHERTQAGDWFVTKPRIRKYDHPYNGHLRIRFMINASYRRYVKDKPNLLLEDQLSKIILSFYQTYIETADCKK